jgi:hypothetical protein
LCFSWVLLSGALQLCRCCLSLLGAAFCEIARCLLLYKGVLLCSPCCFVLLGWWVYVGVLCLHCCCWLLLCAHVYVACKAWCVWRRRCVAPAHCLAHFAQVVEGHGAYAWCHHQCSPLPLVGVEGVHVLSASTTCTECAALCSFVVCLTSTQSACRMAGFDQRALQAQTAPVVGAGHAVLCRPVHKTCCFSLCSAVLCCSNTTSTLYDARSILQGVCGAREGGCTILQFAGQ